MSDLLAGPTPVVVVTGANGLVGARVCAVLSERGATVRALVRARGHRPAAARRRGGGGRLHRSGVAADVLTAADVAVTTVHPMGSDLETQERVGVTGTADFARAAADAGVELLVHLSTCAVYDRSPGAGDIDEEGALAGDDGGDYAVTKRDTEAALAAVDGITRVLLRPPAILGAGESSVWNTLRPAAVRDDEQARHAIADASWPWVHVDDLAALTADLATGHVAVAPDASTGPVVGGCTAVNVAAPSATWRDYLGTVAEAVDVEPVWDDEPAWTGAIDTGRARGWGWTPQVGLDAALAEVREGLRTDG